MEGTKSKYFLKARASVSANEVVEVKREDEPLMPVKVEEEHTVPLKLEDGQAIPIIKTEEEGTIPKRENEDSRISAPKKKKKQKTQATDLPASDIPKSFYPIYNQIKHMRSLIVTPVDTMGCATIPITLSDDVPLTPKNYRFQLLVSLMLSSQTKDEVNYKAMRNMKEYFLSQGFNEGITIEAMQWVDEKKLDELIYSVGFHTRKASFIKRAVEILINEHNGDVPNTLEGLTSLPGVGPKMAFLTLQKAWDLNLGIGVDVHVDRLAKMWRWVKNKKGPEETRLELQSWLPKDLWTEINPDLVGFGQTICPPRGKRCDLCFLAKLKLCNSVDRAEIRKVEGMDKDKFDAMNKRLRFDPQPLIDIEDLA